VFARGVTKTSTHARYRFAAFSVQQFSIKMPLLMCTIFNNGKPQTWCTKLLALQRWHYTQRGQRTRVTARSRRAFETMYTYKYIYVDCCSRRDPKLVSPVHCYKFKIVRTNIRLVLLKMRRYRLCWVPN